MPWQPLPRIAFAVANYPFTPASEADLPLQIGDELYVIEETPDGKWLRGYLMAPPSLLAGLTSTKGQTLEARVFSGIFPRSCVEVREMLGEPDSAEDDNDEHSISDERSLVDGVPASDSAKSGVNGTNREGRLKRRNKDQARHLPNGIQGNLSVPVLRNPDEQRPAAPVPMLKIGDETPTSATEPLIDEISSCLREWHSTNLHELLLSRQYGRLDQLSKLITDLNLGRQQFLYNILTAHEVERLREKTVWDLVKVNKLCGGEVIVRDPAANGRILTSDDSAVELTKLQSVMSLLDEPPRSTAEASTLHHLLLNVQGFAGQSSEETSLVFSLVSKSPHEKLTTLSEAFSVDITSGGTLGSLTQDAQTKTLFTDLAPQDIGDAPSTENELYLVVKILTSQAIVTAKPPSRSGTTNPTSYSKEPTQAPPMSGGKSSRRSLMWGARSAFSRGATAASKMEPVSEQPDRRPTTDRRESRDDSGPPSTGTSKKGAFGTETQTAQRTVGVGVLKLNSIIKSEDEIEQLVSIWARSTKASNDGDEWDPVIREIMESPMGHYEKSRRGERLQVNLRAFNHANADGLIKATPTLLSGVSQTSKMGFSGAPSKPRSDIYFTLNHAALARQNLLSRYGGSATAMPPSAQGGNFQITMEVRRSSGERIENCIYASSNSTGLTTFKSVAVERGESWGQTLRLSLTPSDVADAHVVMFLSDMPNPPFAVAYVPLWDQQAFMRDGSHGLFLYKIDEYTSTALAGPVGKGGYLSLPWGPRGRDERSAEVTGPLAVLIVDSFLCSTKFSQDRVILGLLKWKELPKDSIPTTLRQLVFVPEIEIVKLLSNVLDGLFDILVEYSENEEYEDLVFTALIRVLGIVHDRRFNLGPLVDHYAENQFNYPFATPCLIRSFTRLLENPTEPDTARKLRATLKIVRHILKFITQSRGQQKAKEAVLGITSSVSGFSRHLRSIFKALDQMMRNTSPLLVGSQTLAVQHFHTWLPELSGLLTTEEILHIAIDFMDSCENVKGKLVLYKLVLVVNYSKLDLFSHPDQKSALCANTVRWIKPHWGHSDEINEQWREQIRLCCSVVASQIDHLGNEIPEYVSRIIDSYLAVNSVERAPKKRLSLLFPSSYPFPTRVTDIPLTYDETLAELSAVLASISNSTAGMQLEMADDDLPTTLENILQVHSSILNGEACPADWLSVKIYHHKSTMNALQYISTFMLDSFVPDPEDAETFSTDLWKLFFTTLLKLVGSPFLALETFPEQKRRAAWKIAGDVRESGAELLRTTWEAIGWDANSEEQARYGLPKIGGYQVQYVPTLVGPIVELCLSVHEGLRRMAVEVLQTMIVGEWTLSEDLSAIQTEVIECLDTYFKTRAPGDSMLQMLFISELLDRFEPLSATPDEPLYVAVTELIGTLDEFLELLAAVHGGDNTTEATKLIDRLRLMEFLRDMQKEEIFVRYVHQLARFQVESTNHAEAGLALRLHADLYEWDPTRQIPALADPEFPAQTVFERKEKIYFDMIKHFEEGESWSNAITAYKELQTQYEVNIFDFAKLARTQRAIATIYETIAKTEKTNLKYFRVIFKGQGFPSSVQDKEYIYEGELNERGSGFADRMQEQYPNAKVVTSGDVDEVEGQFLVISNVTAHKDLTHEVYQRTRVPQITRDFLLTSHPQSFSVTTKRLTLGPANEHYSVKTIFYTAEPFPTILRRSEIVEAQSVTLEAHETALERIVRKTQEMVFLERRVLSSGDQDSAPMLIDAVSASVNPDSENSVVCYRQLLPQPKPLNDGNDSDEDEDEEDEEDDDEELELEPRDKSIKMALIDHAIIIKRCLALFARSDNELLSRRHEELQSYFELTFESEIGLFAAPQLPKLDTLLRTSPTWTRSSPVREQPTSPPNIGAILNGHNTEEMSVAQPVTFKQRGSRLSFLGGKRKDSDASPHEGGLVNGDTTTPLSGVGKDQHRTSFFRAAPAEPERKHSADLSSRRSSDADDKHAIENGLGKKGSVRKRLSMLKLGMKSGKGGGMMGSLDEE